MDLQRVVYIIDRDPDSRESLVSTVTGMGFAVLAHGSIEEFQATSLDDRLGCLILSLHAPAEAGLAALEFLASRPSALPIIVVTDCTAVPPAVRAMQLGVEAYLQKHCFSETALWESIHSAFAKDSVQRASYLHRQSLRDKLQELSSREQHVLELLVQGNDHRQISQDLGISRRTVENRRARIMQKLGAKTFPQLIAIAIELGIPPKET